MWMYLGGVGHVELIVGFFGLTMRMEYISENTYIVQIDTMLPGMDATLHKQIVLPYMDNHVST